MNCKNSRKTWALFAILLTMSMSSIDKAWGQVPTVQTTNVSYITALSARGDGQVTAIGGSPVTERGICWGTTQNPTIGGSHLANGSGLGYFAVEMTGLTSETTYYVRAYAKNNSGTAYGQQMTFTTLAIGAPSVTTLDVIRIRHNYAVGVARVTDQGNDPNTERGVCWSSTNPLPTIDDNHASNGTGEGNYSVDMTNLEPNTRYYMRAYATNSNGQTTYGEAKAFHTHVHMQNGTIEVEDGGFVFTDSDADPDGGWYYNYDEFTVHFIPKNPAYGIQIVFDSLLINNDMLYFYDGDISDNNLIGVFTCNEYHAYSHNAGEQISVFGLGGNLFSVMSHNFITVRFVADYHWRDFGWYAHVYQVPFTPQPPTIAKISCLDDTFVLLPTSKGQYSTTLKYSVAYGGAEPDEPNTTYTEGTPININGDYPVKFRVKTEIMESADGEPISSETRLFTFGNESLVVRPNIPEIELISGTSSVTISVVRPGDLNDTWKILYTLDGSDPSTSSTAQAITTTTEDPVTYEVTTSGTVALHDFCTVKAVVQGTTCPNVFSDEASYEYDDTHYIYLIPPTISFTEIGDGSTASTTITPPTDGCVIYYQVNDGPEQIYAGPFTVNANDHVKARVTKQGNYYDSGYAESTYLPGANNPGGASGVYGSVVYLDDREDHSWSYYSDDTQPVHRLNPADVKITYFGNGTGNMTSASESGDAPTSFSENATGVMVGVAEGETQNTFVYYETLERANEDGSGNLPYTIIPNPFQVRPTGSSGSITPTTRDIYVAWGRNNNNVTGSLKIGYYDENEEFHEPTHNINGGGTVTINAKIGTMVTFTLTCNSGGSNNRRYVYFSANYDGSNGPTFISQQTNGINGTSNNYPTGPIQAGESITVSQYRGFYAWRVKYLKGVSITDGSNTYGVNSIIHAETRIQFVTNNEYGNEVEFEALWAQAYVVTSNDASNLNTNVTYERNFVVGVTNIGTTALSVPVTYSSYYPNGIQYTQNNVTLGNFTCAADTKFENMNLNAGNNQITANNHYMCFGRGINTVGVPARVQGINENKSNLSYTIRIESGRYYRLAFVRDQDGTTVSGRYLVKGILGSDYDRAKNDNSKLSVASYDDGTNNDGEGDNNTTNNRLFFSYGVTFSGNANKDVETFNLVVKSGEYQKHWWKNGGNGRYNRSFYLGQNNAGATYPGVRYITVEGGEFGSMNGGRGTNTANNATPSVVTWSARIKGGTFHGSVFGAAADNEAPGSRRIVVTRGQIEGWIAGGCNGTGEQNGTGSTNGDSYIYVGGEAIIGREDPPIVVNTTPGGNVFGAGRGIDTRNTAINTSHVVVADDSYIYNDVYGGGYHGYITQQANVYVVGGTVGNNVYGGAYEHGHTPAIPATRVYIRNGQVNGSVYGGSNAVGNIGNNNAIVEMVGGTVGTTGSFEEGCVFGGGYLDAHVLSNTIVSINGGLIVNNVYGGGNRGRVDGKATVNIVGGQVGDVHDNVNPTKGNVYGGGKGVAAAGDITTVNETEVNIIGSNIMGSVFGGGENGHVLTNTVVTVEGGQVGDPDDICHNPYHGSVYGGGSGLNLDNNGNMVGVNAEDGWVKGNTTVNIVSGAHIMRNVYGGSNVASVGMTSGTETINGNTYAIPVPYTGLATVNISGGIIGTDGENDIIEYLGQETVVSNGMVYGSSHGKAVIGQPEFAHVNSTHVIISAGADIRGSVFGSGDDGYVLDSTFVEIIDGTIGTPLTAEECEVDKYGSGAIIYRGNVYGGGRGIDRDGNNNLSPIAGFVKKNTRVVMTGGFVRHNVYGGGSLASVGFRENLNTGKTTVHISGGQVGSTGLNNGRVFGSGRGMAADAAHPIYTELAYANNTNVTIDGSAKVMGSAFGGGENGHVTQRTKVTIDGEATIGNENMYSFTGNVFGGGRGVDRAGENNNQISPTAGKVFEGTEVYVKNGLVYHNVFGGGDMASVGLPDDDQGFPTFANDEEEKAYGLAKVVVSGGVVGIDGNNNGHVFGSCHGQAGEQYKDLAYTRYTDVTITENALVHGSVFGSGENGHVLKDTHVTVEADCTIGTIGNTGYEGNVYGGGRGIDLDDNNQLSPTAGKTLGNTVVDMTGGWVKSSVYGGGSLASVGIEDEEPDENDEYHTGHTLVTISGGQVGTTLDAHNNVEIGGNVYGGGKGHAGVAYKDFTFAKNTEVHILDNAKIHGSVFGGGEDGHVRQTSQVHIEGGEVGDSESQCTNRFHGNVYGGGRGIDLDEQGNYSWTAGHVNWSSLVNVSGGRVFRNVYGGGNIASVGLVALDTETNEVMLKPNNISELTPYDVVPVDKFGHPKYTYEVVNDEVVWDEEPNPLFGKKDANSAYSDDNLTGWARVNITGGIVGTPEDQDHEHGNVFGSCHGKAGVEYQHLAFVINTDVRVEYEEEEGDADNVIEGSVFGGGEDGHVNMNTKVTVNAGKIGNVENDDKKGNVYGGGRGIDMDANGELSPSAGLVKGHTRVYINGGLISNSVFASANMSGVWQEKVANINGGKVKGSVYGGSKSVPTNRLHHELKTVNVRNGHVYGNVYGCSHSSTDGINGIDPTLGDFYWTSFVNVSGGLIDGNVHAAGYTSLVNGSTCVNIGKNAILYAKSHTANLYYNDRGGDEPTAVLNDGNTTTIEPKVENPLIIHGSVYGGSDYYGAEGSGNWSHYDVNGLTNILIDGKGYNTTDSGESTTAYMSIDGGLFGSSTHCESGDLGRHILLRNYGTRVTSAKEGENGQMTSATRTLTTIQRCNNLIVDNANVNLSGMSDITGLSSRNYAVLKVDDTLYMVNASSFNLGSVTAPAYMDSIFAVRSLHTVNNDTVYNKYLYQAWDLTWEWIGVNPLSGNPNSGNTLENARLFYKDTAPTTALTFDKENVILFNGDSRLWVRYHDMVDGVNKQLYGELQGFFRMKSPFPTYGTESFAYARPKTTEYNNNLPQIQGQELYINTSDGGFLSYETEKNFFTSIGNYGGWNYTTDGNDGGTEFTFTKQYPYFNILELSRGINVEEYREWVIPQFNGKRWYVDGRGVGQDLEGWGMDKRHQEGWGHFPDKPKETVSAAVGTDNLHKGGVCYDDEIIASGYPVFNPAEDIIYVVGPISAAKENPTAMNRYPTQYTLKLYRYPGGHEMSNGEIDATISTNPAPAPEDTEYNGLGDDVVAGPGANVNAMLNVEENISLDMNNILMDGLYGYLSHEVNYHEIPTTFRNELTKVNEPLAVTYPNATLSLTGSVPLNELHMSKFGTIVQRGCNNINAEEWYTDADYDGDVHHGGGIYVNEEATVNVEKLVTVADSKQILRLGNAPSDIIDCNVYLPTFAKHLYITDELNEGSLIGVTSPIRNTSYHYVHNTFSPVAVANKANPAEGENESIALTAWVHNNFLDDQQWFFVNGHTQINHKDTYYATSILDYEYPYTNGDAKVNHFDPTKTLFFGWTWANVVRKAPDQFDYNNIDTREDLAWLISLVNGLNRQNPTPLTDVTVKQTYDFNLQPYVWVPIGALKAGCSTFGGTFDGQGHLIDYMDIAYIGDGDRRYERTNYGLFGGVDGGKIDRTFVTSGYVYPVGTANIGGLVGSLNGQTAVVSNSEASVDIHSPENSKEAIGGLVGVMNAGTIHSSMSMSILNSTSNNVIGGLVGRSESTATKIYNSYSNAKYLMTGVTQSPTIGGIIGVNMNTTIQNCYVHMQTGYTGLNTFALLVGESDGGAVSKCYVQTTEEDFPLSKALAPGEDPFVTNCFKYNEVMGADNLGYMYYDNVVENDTTLYSRLNLNATTLNSESNIYSYWARPAIPEINGDLPVPMLCDEDGTALHQGSFRSLGTYRGGHPLTGAFPEEDDNNPYVVLQYGGPIRHERELDSMMYRMTERDYLFVYGDVTEQVALPTVAGKVSVYEEAAIQHPGELANNYNNTYVGISFDNSFGKAYSTPGVNHLDSQLLPRDWHMFSSSLTDAPLGFDYIYNGENTNLSQHYQGGDIGTYYNNPWPFVDGQTGTNTEFLWLNGGTTTGDKRYWMKNFVPTDQKTDGYFPTQRPELFNDENGNPNLEAYPKLFIEGSAEHPGGNRFRYPYGMDMFCWYEAHPQWVNFKRNGPNHWHGDETIIETAPYHIHLHLPYTENGIENQNEDDLVIGKGYMASMSIMTQLQSHGTLTANDQTRTVTRLGSSCKGWNLVGNPYHSYLDFDEFARINGRNIDASYVVYNADGYGDNEQSAYPGDQPRSAFKVYPAGGSIGGDYAKQYLHPHQGFFILSKGGDVVTFTENMTATRNDANDEGNFRNWKPNYPLVNLYLSSEQGCADLTTIEFHRPEWGGAHKLKELRQGNGLFYAYHDGESYAALFTKEGATRVPLWFEPKENDIYTISWNMANGYFTSLYLIDNLTGIQYDMLENDCYVFEGHTQDYASRFYIAFECTDVEEHEEEVDNTFAFFDGSQWVITGEGSLELIDLQGRVLWNARIVGGQSRVSLPNVATGLYLFRLTNANETRVQKIVIK